MYQICVLTWCAQQQQSRPSSQSVRKVYPQSTASNERHGDSRDELERLAERIEGVEDAKLWPENRSNQMQRVLNLRLKELETAYDNLHDACAKKPKSITSSAHSSPQSPPCHTENCLQERRLRERLRTLRHDADVAATEDEEHMQQSPGSVLEEAKFVLLEAQNSVTERSNGSAQAQLSDTQANQTVAEDDEANSIRVQTLRNLIYGDQLRNSSGSQPATTPDRQVRMSKIDMEDMLSEMIVDRFLDKDQSREPTTTDEDEGAAAMFKAYARDAQAHGRAVHVAHD